MKPQYDLLGKSHYALAIICDTLSLLHPDGFVVQIVSNIPEEKNESRDHAFETSGVEWTTVDSQVYNPNPTVPKILGSIGKSRRAIVQHFATEHGITPNQYQSLIHPSAILASTVKVGHGVHIGPGSTVGPYSTVSDFCVINRNVSVGHHTTMGDFCCLNPGVTLAGVCNLGRYTTIGAGSTIIDQIDIGHHTVIGAGSVVTKDIPENTVAYGVPAKVVRSIQQD